MAPFVLMPPVQEARLLRKTNRFVAEVEVTGAIYTAHVPNTGRLQELLFPGNTVLVAAKHHPRRKTGWEVLMAYHPSGVLVAIDTRVPNQLFSLGIKARTITEFSGYHQISAEYTFGTSRLDFRLDGLGLPPCLVEVKSVTLAENGIGQFPDAPTGRGTKHLTALAEAVQKGWRGVIFFMIQREDVTLFRPHDLMDPEFARSLRTANKAGVEILAYKCLVEPRGITLDGLVPICLE
ncbi:MAG: DNA/RNA nuclease SfsA [Bacillota bacterium]